MKNAKFLSAGFLLLFFAGVCTSPAGTKTWTAGTGDWFTVGNWTGGDYPRVGDDVVITNAGASVLLTNSTEYLSSITLSATGVSANTLVFSNWNTTLSTTNVYVRTNATVTLPPAFTAAQMSNNVYIICSNLTIDAGGSINVNVKGYAAESGPGKGMSSYECGGGGGYGGVGGAGYYNYAGYGPAGGVYGLTNAPVIPGSGGGYAGQGGSGGGAVRIEAGGVVTVSGVICANGGNSTWSPGGGSGGAIYIQCSTIAGSGSLQANGGNGPEITSNGRFGGGGGGGRIAVLYNTAAQSFVPLRFSTAAGIGAAYGDIGTLYFPDTRFWSQETIIHNGQVIIPGFTNWAPNNILVSNIWVRFMTDGFQLTVTNQVTVVGTNTGIHKLDLPSAALASGSSVLVDGGTLVIGASTSGPILNCAGDLTLTNRGRLRVSAGITNAASTNYGGMVAVIGDVWIASNCWVYPYSNPTKGGSIRFRMRNLTIPTTNAGFDANSSGYTIAAGPGRGSASYETGSGGGYGGIGGWSEYNGAKMCQGGTTYGSSNAPVDPGSGGGGTGAGGGAVWLEASRVITVNGVIRANGGSGGSNYGGGSGGGIYIWCYRLAGDGSLEANGGSSVPYTGQMRCGGGGGGGRIAVRMVHGTLAASVDAGIGYSNGVPGTIVWSQLPMPGTVFYGR